MTREGRVVKQFIHKETRHDGLLFCLLLFAFGWLTVLAGVVQRPYSTLLCVTKSGDTHSFFVSFAAKQ